MSQTSQRVGQYNFLKKLGAGRMAEVFLGRIEGAEGFQKPVAIKKIRPELAADSQFVQSLIVEAKIGGQLHHRDIVEVYDFIRYGNDYCIIMEYVDGVDLARVLKFARRYRVRIPPAAALYIASQICDGLDYAHSAKGFNGEPLNIVHRDLKPSNVLISIKGGVKITDFGIASVMEKAAARMPNADLKPVLHYRSPEQLAGTARLTAASDIYSVGVILFELLTLEPLFGSRDNGLPEELDDDELRRRLAIAQRQLPRSDRILMTALNPNPAERFRSAGKMAEEIRALLVDMKVDDPRERLVTFFSRLVRIVQEQANKGNTSANESETESGGEASRGDAWDDSRGASKGALSEGRANTDVDDHRSAAGAAAADASAPAGASPEIPLNDYEAAGSSSESVTEGADETMRRSALDEPAPAAAHLQRHEGVIAASAEETAVRPYSTVNEIDVGQGRRENLASPSEGARSSIPSEHTAPLPSPRTSDPSTRILETQKEGAPPPVHGYAADQAPASPPSNPSPSSTAAFNDTTLLKPAGASSGSGAFDDGTNILPREHYAPSAGDGNGAAADMSDMAGRQGVPSKGIRRLLMLAAVLLVLIGGGIIGSRLLFQAGGESEVPAAAGAVQCPNCGRHIPCTPYCGFCGQKLSCESAAAEAVEICTHCGFSNEPGAKFCASCGRRLGEDGDHVDSQ